MRLSFTSTTHKLPNWGFIHFS